LKTKATQNASVYLTILRTDIMAKRFRSSETFVNKINLKTKSFRVHSATCVTVQLSKLLSVAFSVSITLVEEDIDV